ncbi:MAG TPA: L,D-transpeptidase family protein [Sphingomicrobium sp.]|nr:L,D-transpeptidase family protein [Sphingomicrobium sp.]
MRFSLLLASAAALSLAACSNSPAGTGNTQSDIASQVADKDLEQQVMAALSDAPKHGLTKDLFLKGELPSDSTQRRQLLLKAANDFASALAVGKVDPAKIRDVYTLPRPKVDIASGLATALEQNKYRDWVNSLAPQTPEYQALSKAFVALVQRSPGLPDADIPAGDTIKPGDRDPRVAAIVGNLKAQGYLQSADESKPAPAPTRYSGVIVQAVKQWQADSGLKPDGIIGPDTIKALNSSPRDRARTLAVAMERLRWLDRSPPATRIDVNTAAAFLDYFRDGQHVDHRKVVDGEPGKETPQLGSPIFQLVANPTWTVPHSIDEEMAGKSSAWLAANNFTRKDGQWVQASGPKNSLGIVKFDMKNDHAIYLHDTPAKALFAEDDRHRSHGCVRVEDAIGFAHMLAQADGVDAEFSKAMATGKETFVKLKQEIPVRLLYHTAFLGDDGRVHFVSDAYGWDNDVATALGYASVVRGPVKQTSEDIGP